MSRNYGIPAEPAEDDHSARPPFWAGCSASSRAALSLSRFGRGLHMAEITDEMVGRACETAFGPVWSFVEAEAMREAITAIAPLIRAAAFREAAAVADEHRDDCAGKLSRGRRSWSDHDIAVFESAESEANSISVALRALAQKETTNG